MHVFNNNFKDYYEKRRTVIKVPTIFPILKYSQPNLTESLYIASQIESVIVVRFNGLREIRLINFLENTRTKVIKIDFDNFSHSSDNRQVEIVVDTLHFFKRHGYSFLTGFDILIKNDSLINLAKMEENLSLWIGIVFAIGLAHDRRGAKYNIEENIYRLLESDGHKRELIRNVYAIINTRKKHLLRLTDTEFRLEKRYIEISARGYYFGYLKIIGKSTKLIPKYADANERIKLASAEFLEKTKMVFSQNELKYDNFQIQADLVSNVTNRKLFRHILFKKKLFNMLVKSLKDNDYKKVGQCLKEAFEDQVEEYYEKISPEFNLIFHELVRSGHCLGATLILNDTSDGIIFISNSKHINLIKDDLPLHIKEKYNIMTQVELIDIEDAQLEYSSL